MHATQFFEFVASIADAATADGTVRLAPVFFQPIAGDDVAQAVGRIAVGPPLNGRGEVAGPERFRMDEFFREALAARHDPREVVTDPHARYFAAELSEGSLVPGGDAILAETRYRDWPLVTFYPISGPTTFTVTYSGNSWQQPATATTSASP